MNPLLIRRRGMMKAQQGNLPYDAEIEYLENTGACYINTGFVPNQNDVRVVAKAYKPSTSTGDHIMFAMQTYNNCMFNLDWYNGIVYFRYRDYNSSFSAAWGLHEFEIGPKMIIDGIVQATPSFNSSYTFVGNTNEIVLFSSAVYSYNFKGRVYYFKVYYGDELKLDLIPVRVGTVGYMYDRVSGQLFGNQGTGDFVLGPDEN